MKYRALPAMLAGVVVVGLCVCTKTRPTAVTESVTLSPEAGQFGLSYLKGLGKAHAPADTDAVAAGPRITFDLGRIKGSTSFYFLLYNIGRRPIANVTLRVDNPNFEVYPDRIDTLMPNGDVGMLPVVKISALHGTAPDGVGYRALMPMGDNQTTLTIQGMTTTNDGSPTATGVSATLKLHALVMDIDVRIVDRNVDFTQPTTMGGYCDVGYGRYGPSSDTTFTIINTGNVPVGVDVQVRAARDGYCIDTLFHTIPVNDSITFPTIGWTGHIIEEYGVYLLIHLDGGNTVMPSNLPVYPDALKCFTIIGPPWRPSVVTTNPEAVLSDALP